MPHVYLCTAAGLRGLDGDSEQAARSAGAGFWRVAFSVSLPMTIPAILFAAALVFFLGFELFGLPLVLGDAQGLLVLSTYLYKLTNEVEVPPLELTAVVIVIIVAISLPLLFIQRIIPLARYGGGLSLNAPKPARFVPFRLAFGACRYSSRSHSGLPQPCLCRLLRSRCDHSQRPGLNIPGSWTR